MIYTSVKSLLDDLHQKIISSDLENALGLAKLYGNLVWSNHVGIYSAYAIENCLFNKLNDYKKLTINQKLEKNGKILHVLSDGYTAGGHTRVVERLLNENKKDPIQDVLVVGICPKEVLLKMRSKGANINYINSRGVAAIFDLVSIMSKYSSVLLHINPDEIVATLAARVARDNGTKVGLYNHADHCFTYGFTAAEIIFEISILGRSISEKYRQEYKWSFAGIPLENSEFFGEEATGDYFLSSGPSYKYDFRQGGVFASILESLIPESGKKCILIGPDVLPSDSSEKLKEFSKDGRLLILPQVKYDVYIHYMKHCFCYLDSAPVTGGSALPEAAMLGKPCLGLINPIMGYSPVDSIRSASIRDLVKRALDLNSENRCLPDKLMLEVHMGCNVLNRIQRGLNCDELFIIPFNISEEKLNPDFMVSKWRELKIFSINGPGFDFLSFNSRLYFLISLANNGLISNIIKQKKIIGLLSLFLSNFTYRKFRGYRLRSIPSEAILLLKKKKIKILKYWKRIFKI
jgi:hypothetical protein